MSGTVRSGRAELPLEVLDRIDQICDRFEAAWASGGQPRVEDYLSEVEEAHRSALAEDLRDAETDARRRRGERRNDDSPSVRRLGDYRIERELGRGGMGVVYRAFDETREVVVALKTLHRADVAAGIVRFKREFRTLVDVSHPNLVSLYELGSDGESWFFTMELVDGVDFLTFVRSGSSLSVPEGAADLAPPEPGLPADALPRLRAALRQLAEGITVLHDAGILHRDLKPSNVLVTAQGRVVILDFGLAAELGPSGLHESSAPQVLGTVSYVAPEQAAGRAVSPASDWYSFGSMLYEVLTGRPPFVGRPLDVLMDKQKWEPPAPCEVAEGIPDDLNALCVDLLRRQPEARPTGRDVLRLLAKTTGEPELPDHLQPSPHLGTPLVGRNRHLECLQRAFVDMCHGHSVICSIHGPSGVGKTSLVRRFLDGQISRQDAVVLAGRCYEQESVPYKALDSVVDALGRFLKRLPVLEGQALLPRDLRSLVRVFPALGEAEAVATAPWSTGEVPDPQELRRRAFSALRELLARLGDRRPLILAIDDLQWGDVDSARLLAELLRPPDAPRILLLVCYRSEDAAASACLRTLHVTLEQDGSRIDNRELAIGTLEAAEAESLALLLLGREDQAARSHATAIARESGGNPFFVAELVRHVLADTKRMNGEPARTEVDLDLVLLERIRRLPGEAQRLLEIVAVSGRPLGQREAARAADLGADDRSAFALLRAGRLIRSTSPAERDEIETYHDRVRETLIASLSPTTWEDHHRRLALVLEASGRADPEILAVHFFQGSRDFERAGMYFEKAAEKAARALAFDRAANLYRLALEIRPGDDAHARQLRIGIADALANAGRGAEAAKEYLAATAGATVAQKHELRRLATMQYLISGHIDEGFSELNVVLTGVGMAWPSTPRQAMRSLALHRLRLWLHGLHFRVRGPRQVPPEELTRIDVCATAASGLGITDPIRGADFQARGLLLALRAGEPNRIAQALAVEAAFVSTAGGPSDRRVSRLLQAAREIAQQLDDPQVSGLVLGAQGIAAYFSGHWSRAGELCDQARFVLRTRCTGVTWEVDRLNLFSLWSLQFRGELAALGRLWPVLLNEARERGDRYMLTNLNSFLMSTLRLAADNWEAAEAELSEVMSQWSRQGFHVQHNEGFGADVQIRLYRGDGAGAWGFFTTQYAPSLARSHLMRLQKIRIFLYERRARSALAAARDAASSRPLLRAADRDARRLIREDMAWSRALALPIRAGVAAMRGDLSSAARLLAEAVVQLERVEMRLYAAASRRRLGELLGGDEGRAEVDRADSWMRQQGIQNPARMADVFAPAVT